MKSAYLYNILCCTIEEGDRRQPTPNPSQEGKDSRQEENYMGIRSPK
ncbi:hypothetical protein [Okeania sp. SIO2C2]|nr:hypothetical protein [Okeania sp. SIO2C2]